MEDYLTVMDTKMCVKIIIVLRGNKQVRFEGKLTVERLSILVTPDRGLTIRKELLLFHPSGHMKREIIFKFLFEAFSEAAN